MIAVKRHLGATTAVREADEWKWRKSKQHKYRAICASPGR
jgi:hypothetical protein